MASLKGVSPEAYEEMLKSGKQDEIVSLLREIRDAVLRMSPKPRVFNPWPDVDVQRKVE